MHSSRPNTIQKLKKEKLIDTFSKYNWNLDDPIIGLNDCEILFK